MIRLGLSAGGGLPDAEPGVHSAPPDPEAGPPGVQRAGLVAETPSRPEAVVTLGPYSASTVCSGRLSRRMSWGASGVGPSRIRPLSPRVIRITWLAAGPW